MANDAVWLDVLANFATFDKQLQDGSKKAGVEAGKATGNAWSKAFATSAGDGGSEAVVEKLKASEAKAEKAVKASTAEIGRARAAQSEAAARVILAEEKLELALKKSGEGSAQAQAAALRLEAAREKAEGASRRVENAEDALRASHKELKATQEQVTDAVEQSTRENKESASGWGDVADSVEDASEETKGFGRSLGGMVGMVAGAVGAAALFAASWSDAMDLTAGTAKLEAALDLTEAQSQVAGEVAGGLYADSYGESLGDVTGAVEAVISSLDGMRDASAADLEAVTGQAMSLASAFDLDVTEAVNSAAQLINQGLASDATSAFDLITASLQKVPAALRGEVMDATHEYSQFFAQLGLDGPEAMGLLVAASEDGQYGIDKMGDALKELTIRSTDMSSTSVAAYEAAGLSAEAMSARFLAGGDTARGALDDLITGLQGIEDPTERANAAISLFGTPLEDLSTGDIPNFLDQLSSMDSSLGDVSGAAGELDDKMKGTVDPIESVKRSFMMMLTEGITPLVKPLQGFAEWAKNTPGVLEAVGVGLGIVTVAWAAMTIAASPWLAIGVGIAAVIAGVILAVKNWGTITEWVSAKVSEALEWAGQKVDEVGAWIGETWDSVQTDLQAGYYWIQANVIDKFVAGWKWASDKFTLAKFTVLLAWELIKLGLKSGWDWIDKNVFSPLKRGVGYVSDAFDKAQSAIGSAWAKIKAAAAKPVNFVLMTVYQDGIRKWATSVASKLGITLNLPEAKRIAYAHGGIHAPHVLPGYSPGIDNYTFTNPLLGSIRLGGGEGILVPEAVRGLGADFVGWANQHFSGGRSNGGVGTPQAGGHSHAFAGGGIIDWFKDKAAGVGKFLSDPLGAVADLITKPAEALLNSLGSSVWADMGKGVARKILGGIPTWFKKKSSSVEVPGGAAAGAGAPGGGPAGSFNPIGWQAMVGIINRAFPNASITSTYRPGSGLSMHGKGRAIDIASSNMVQIAEWLLKNYPNSYQVLHSPLGARNIWWAGQRGFPPGYLYSTHFDHVHWAMEKGGVVPDWESIGTLNNALLTGLLSTGVGRKAGPHHEYEVGVEDLARVQGLHQATYDNGGPLYPGYTLAYNGTGRVETVRTFEDERALTASRVEFPREITLVDRDGELIARMEAIADGAVEDLSDARFVSRMGVS